ncbi:Mpo1 family 2-hydroxy fatty acid dioxygenase [Paraburkholderia solisilvae]|uniref:DUF962 domain-containing protein n=1 Tax=Paraburkholderia solisilvae TaxID=624376 RepID=A0A6J5D022_9BURK|nr:Mpo1-like protein [Paraburkholderia solisilvae]CAB3747760.1 hypothetical protein LMG29739_00391 [Paraburkholderia solisilvae]
MRTLTEQLAGYAAYHRDPRNVATHCVGIPMIVFALGVLLGRPAATFGVLPVEVSPAWILFVAGTIYYLALDVALGIMMALLSALCVACGQWIAAQSTPLWLTTGTALFALGWVFQFFGHAAFEHRKPAFVDDLVGLMIGPLFVLVEALLSVGWRPALRESIERQIEAAHPHAKPGRS